MAQDFDKSGPFIAVGGMSVAFFLYAYTAVALPGLVSSLVLPLLWVVLLVVALRWFTRRPKASMLVPVVAVAMWFAVVLLVPR